MAGKPSRSVRWSEEALARFLEAYERRECLWDTAASSYKNSEAKMAALEEIVRVMELKRLTVRDVKDKIKSVRTVYRRELIKVLASQQGVGRPYMPKLVWFRKADSFLRRVLVIKPGPYHEDSIPGGAASESILPDAGLEEEFPDASDSTSGEDTQTLSAAPAVPDCHVVTPPCSKRPRIVSCVSTADPPQVFPQPDPEGAQPSRFEAEEFQVFGQYVAVQLRKLPLYRALVCQQRIQALLTEERLDQLQQHSCASR